MSLMEQLSQILLPLEQSGQTSSSCINQSVETLASNKNSHKLTSDQQTYFKKAGVLLPIFFDNNTQQWQLILTKRAEHLKHHPGQISFPGGRYESDDLNLHTTALRETHEEIGIAPDNVTLLGRLALQKTTSQYQVTPFVGLVTSNKQVNTYSRNNFTKNSYLFDFNGNIKIDRNEVAEAFYLPLDYVCNTNNQKKIAQSIKGKTYRFYQIQYEQYNIWGATASIIVNFSKQFNQLKNTLK
jgi:8-oxo-dGTP pyrophosphatase MutT (NUDIX family)